MSETAEVRSVTTDLDVIPETSTEEVTGSSFPNKSTVNVADEGIRKVEAVNENSKTMNSEAKEKKIAPVPKRQTLKRKATNLLTSEMAQDAIKIIKKRIKTKYEKSKTMISEAKEKKVAPVPKRQTLKRKAADPPTSEMMQDSNKILKKRKKNGNGKSKTMNSEAKKLNVVPMPERQSMKRKAAHPPISEMVIDSIKAVKKRNGATLEDIAKCMAEKYQVNMKVLKSHVNKFLQKSVVNGILEKIGVAGTEGKFKIKKKESRENVKKDAQNLRRKEGKEKQGRKIIAAKKQVKK